MKFNEIEYIQIDYEKIKEEYTSLTNELKIVKMLMKH